MRQCPSLPVSHLTLLWFVSTFCEPQAPTPIWRVWKRESSHLVFDIHISYCSHRSKWIFNIKLVLQLLHVEMSWNCHPNPEPGLWEGFRGTKLSAFPGLKWTKVYLHIYVYTYIHICTYAHIHIYVYTYTYIYKCMYTHIYKYNFPGFCFTPSIKVECFCVLGNVYTIFLSWENCEKTHFSNFMNWFF